MFYWNVNIPVTALKNKLSVLSVFFEGLLSAQLEQPIRVLLAQAHQSPNPCNMVPVYRPANLEVCQCGCVSWCFLSLLCFYIMCTRVWSLQKRLPLKPLSRGAVSCFKYVHQPQLIRFSRTNKNIACNIFCKNTDFERFNTRYCG